MRRVRRSLQPEAAGAGRKRVDGEHGVRALAYPVGPCSPLGSVYEYHRGAVHRASSAPAWQRWAKRSPEDTNPTSGRRDTHRSRAG